MLSAQQPAPAAPSAAPPSTDIFLLEMKDGLASLASATPQPLATERGYDNQPHFTPDGQAVLFTANRDGKQMDIYEFNRASRKVRPLIATPEGEYSPTIMPDGKSISVIRVESDGTQRLWQFDRDGTNPRVILPNIKPVGYHAWIDADSLALFVLGKPATLQLATVSGGNATTVATDIGRSLHRIPGSRAISYVQRAAGGEYWVMQHGVSPDGGPGRLVRAAEGSTDRDCAWMPDGTLLMSAGSRVLAWKRGDNDWRTVYDGAPQTLGSVSRMAVSPDGRAIAIVVAERAAR